MADRPVQLTDKSFNQPREYASGGSPGHTNTQHASLAVAQVIATTTHWA